VGFWGSSAGGAAGSLDVAAEAGDSGELGDDEDAKGEDSDESSEENVVGNAAGLSSATRLDFDSTGAAGSVSSTRICTRPSIKVSGNAVRVCGPGSSSSPKS
jgi:hypothetical protein